MTTIDFHKTVTSQFRFAVVFARTMRLPCTAPGTGFELAMAPEPTVDDQGMPDDVARSGTAQPKHRRRDLVGLADLADGRGTLATGWTMFQSGSNGGAFGVTIDAALVTALYELIERDAWTLFETVLLATGRYAPKIDPEDAGGDIQDAVERMTSNGATPFLFDITTEIGIRVFACYLFDDIDPSIGVFGGFGCSLDPREAAMRAILEAAQSRCCYVDGARDDLARRSFYLLKKSDHTETRKAIERLPFAGKMKA